MIFPSYEQSIWPAEDGVGKSTSETVLSCKSLVIFEVIIAIAAQTTRSVLANSKKIRSLDVAILYQRANDDHAKHYINKPQVKYPLCRDFLRLYLL